jgi:predicted 3-demethylubiquinone-9 3-methyltransferase (glyoxalase superfamily)
MAPPSIDDLPAPARDRYGLCWQIVPAVFFNMIADPDPAAVARVTRAMMDMTRFDIAGLQQALAGH